MPRKSNTEHLKRLDGIFLKGIAAPACSRLYCIEPVGLATPMIESLTSYVVRLASAHCVTVGALVGLEIAPFINKGYLVDSSSLTMATQFTVQSRAVNGIGITATDWVNALQVLTFQKQLSFLTLLPLKEWIPKNNLLRKFRGWCPNCYEEWAETGETIYDPLLWTLNVVTGCVKHERFLHCLCVHCHKEIPLLPRIAQAGFCPLCKKWLGVAAKNTYRNEILDSKQLRWQAWVYDHIGTIFATTSQLDSLPKRDVIAALVSAIIQKITRGDLKAFVRQFGSFNHRTLDLWQRGQVLPELSRLMDFCYQTDVSMKHVLLGKVNPGALLSRVDTFRNSDSRYRSTAELERMRAALPSMLNENPPLSINEACKRLAWHHKTFKRRFPEFYSAFKERYSIYEAERFDKGKTKSSLLAAIDELPPPSLHSVAKRLGCSRGFLSSNFPEESRIIIKRHTEAWKVFVDPEGVRAEFQALQTECPPLSIAQCAERLGCTSAHLYNYFPDLCHDTGARYADYRKENGRQRREIRRQAIIKISMTLEAEGLPLSHYQIRKRLPHIIFLTNREIDAAITRLSGISK